MTKKPENPKLSRRSFAAGTAAGAAALALGFPAAIFLAWAFEWTPEGVKRDRDADRPFRS